MFIEDSTPLSSELAEFPLCNFHTVWKRDRFFSIGIDISREAVLFAGLRRVITRKHWGRCLS